MYEISNAIYTEIFDTILDTFIF